MKIINDEELNQICKSILQKAINQKSFFIPHIFFMYYFGVRLGETIFKNITHIDENNNLHILPQKKNNERIIKINSSDVAPMLEQLQMKETNPQHNYKALQRELTKLNPQRNIYNGHKNINSHLFRHNYIRRQLKLGNAIEEINNKLGYTNQSIENTYLKGIINI